jgi:hypothetical protein
VPIVYSDGSTPVLAADLTFTAFISARPLDILTEVTYGCAVWDDAGGAGLMVECSMFTELWDIGETLLIHVVGAGSNYSNCEWGTAQCVLGWDNPQYVSGLTLGRDNAHEITMVPVVYSDGVTPILVEDLHFDAFISTRPWHMIHETTPCNCVDDHPDGYGVAVDIECGLFPLAWAFGETLIANITGDGSNYTGPESGEFQCLLAEDQVYWITRWQNPIEGGK